MATFEIDPRKVEALTSTIVRVVEGRRVHLTDIVIALTEATGRIIAAQDISPIAMQELHQVCMEHLERTIRIGAAQRGINLEGR